jgi:hypothetical protein
MSSENDKISGIIPVSNDNAVGDFSNMLSGLGATASLVSKINALPYELRLTVKEFFRFRRWACTA